MSELRVKEAEVTPEELMADLWAHNAFQISQPDETGSRFVHVDLTPLDGTLYPAVGPAQHQTLANTIDSTAGRELFEGRILMPMPDSSSEALYSKHSVFTNRTDGFHLIFDEDGDFESVRAFYHDWPVGIFVGVLNYEVPHIAEAVEDLQRQGSMVDRLITAVDQTYGGGTMKVNGRDIEVVSVLNYEEIIEYMLKKGLITKDIAQTSLDHFVPSEL